MVEQTSPDAYSDGVSGKGQKWKDRVSEDESKTNYSQGATQENGEDLVNNAKDSADDYENNLAAAFGLDSIDNDVTSDWEDNLDSEAASEWTSETGQAADRWEDGVQEVSASDWESEAAEASEEWFNETRDALSPGS